MKTNILRTNFKLVASILFLGLLLHSCSSDDDNVTVNAPVISNFEYGEGSAHSTEQIAYMGSDIHLEAEIIAESSVSSITLSIHAHDLTPGEDEVVWDFEKVYSNEKYLVKNPVFHEHVDVPNNIPTGEYHIMLTVTDELGNKTEVEGHLQILHPIALSDISIDTSVQRGSDFHAEFKIDAINGIHNITVDIHSHGIEPSEGESTWHYKEVFSEGFHGLTTAEFHKHIDVPTTAPSGEYHMTITVKDEDGNSKKIDSHLQVTK